MPPASQESPSTAVERALSMLESIGHSPDGLTNAELSRLLKIPKSSASYILRVLQRRGYVSRESDSGKYQLGLALLSLSRGVLTGLDIRHPALPVMRRLVERIELTSHLAILDRGEAVYIEKVESPGFIKMDTWVGRRMLIHSTSVGKALAAYLPVAELAAILRERGLEKRTPRTITIRARFLHELEKVRAQGYAVDDEENSLGVRCVAAPILDSEGQAKAALGVTGTTTQMTADNVSKIAALVRQAALSISRQLGWHGPARRL